MGREGGRGRQGEGMKDMGRAGEEWDGAGWDEKREGEGVGGIFMLGRGRYGKGRERNVRK